MNVSVAIFEPITPMKLLLLLLALAGLRLFFMLRFLPDVGILQVTGGSLQSQAASYPQFIQPIIIISMLQ